MSAGEISSFDSVAAVVVTYNRKNLLVALLEALLKQTVPLDAIYVIDNHSGDGTFQLLRDRGYLPNVNIEHYGTIEMENTLFMKDSGYPIKLHYHRLAENMGGAGGFYEGIKRSFNRGYKWLWLMDDDIEPTRNCLEELLKCASLQNNIGALMPLRLSPKGHVESYERLTLNYRNPFKSYGGKSVRDIYSDINQMPDNGLELATIPFEGPLINVDVIKQIGLPRPEFFIIGDDTDYAIRISKVSKIRLCPRARVVRVLSQGNNSDKDLTWKDYYYYRNLIILDLIHGTLSVRILRPILFISKRIITFLLKGSSLSNVYLLLLAFKDGLLRKSGKVIEPGFSYKTKR